MDSDLMRHWGGHRRDVYRPYGDDELVKEEEEDEDEAQPKRETLLVGLKLMAIAEECSSSQDAQSIQASQDGQGVVGAHNNIEGEEGDEKQEEVKVIEDNNNKDDKNDDDGDDGPVHEDDNDYHAVPLHSAFGLQAEDLMLKNSLASPTGGKYRTVSVFGGVFAMPEDPVDSDNYSLSSASDGFSSDEEDYNPPPPKRKPQRRSVARTPAISQTATTTTTPSKGETSVAPRVVSPPLASSPLSAATGEPEKKDTPPTTSPAVVPDNTTSPPPAPDAKITVSSDESSENKDTVPLSPSSRAATNPKAAAAATESPMSPVSATKSPLSSTTKSPGDSSMTRALKAFDQTESLLSKVLGELESAPFYAVAPQVMEEAITSLQVSKQTLESALCLEDSVLSC